MIINKENIFIIFSTLIYSFCESASYLDKFHDKYYDNTQKGTYDENGNHEISGVAGERASIKDYPYIVGVIARTSAWGSAAILNKYWVLTSTDAVPHADPEKTLVRAGSDFIIDKGQTSWASKIIKHPDHQEYKNDVALIKLQKPLKFNKLVKAIKLPSNPPKKGAKVSLSGFGFYIYNKTLNANDEKFTGGRRDGWLRATTLDVMTYGECKSYFTDPEYGYFTNSSFCTKPREDRGPAPYDYGSPLVCNKELIGAFSGAYVYLTSTYPPVYTDLYLLKNWIGKTIKDNSDPRELLDMSNDIQYYK